MNDFARLALPLYGLILLFYVPALLYYRRRMRLHWASRRFCRGLLSILNDCQTPEGCAGQVLTLYKTLCERYDGLSEKFRSAVEMLEDLLCYLDTSDPKSFKSLMRLEPPTSLRPRMVTVLEEIRKLQPFSSISSREGNLLAMLKHAVDDANQDLARSTLSQLGDEIEVLESNLRRQERRNRVSFAISLVGVVLTFFFGFVSFVQFLAK